MDQVPDFDLEFLTTLYKGLKLSSCRGDEGSPGNGFVPMLVAIDGAIEVEDGHGWAFMVWEEPTDVLKLGLEAVRAQAMGGRPANQVAVLADAYVATAEKDAGPEESGMTEDLMWVPGMSPQQRFQAGDMNIKEALHLTLMRADGTSASRSIPYRIGDDGLPVFEEPQDFDEAAAGLVPEAMAVLVTP